MDWTVNGTTNSTSGDMDMPAENKIVITKFYPFIAIPIAISNFVVVISSGLILKNKQEPRSTYLFLGNLALADTIFGLHLIFVDFFRAKDDTQYVLCLAQNVLKTSCLLTSPFSVGLIAVDRYLYILYGLQYSSWVFPQRARVSIACTWILSATIGILPVISYSTAIHNKQCLLIDIPSLYILIFSSIGMIPLPIIMVLYSIILYRALQKIKQLRNAKNGTNSGDGLRISISGGSQSTISEINEEPQPPNKHSIRKANKWKAIKIVVLTTGCLAITWFPFFMAFFIYACQCDQFSKNDTCIEFKELVVNYVVFLGFLNSLLNPIIYAWWHKGFRQFVKRKINQLRKSENKNIIPTISSQLNGNRNMQSTSTISTILG